MNLSMYKLKIYAISISKLRTSTDFFFRLHLQKRNDGAKMDLFGPGKQPK